MKNKQHLQKILEQLSNSTLRYKNKLLKFVISYLQQVFKLVLNHKTNLKAVFRLIESNFYKSSINYRFKKKCLNLTRFIINKIEPLVSEREEDGYILTLLLLKKLNKIGALNMFIKLVNEETRIYESANKEQIIEKYKELALKENEVFALVSYHKDSALDHKDYQGKMYLLTNNLTKEEQEEARRLGANKLISEVVNAKPYLLTRPHCRHYFETFKVSEVKNKSCLTLLKENHMIREVGNRQVSSLYQKMNMLQIRIAYNSALNKVANTNYLSEKIAKDKKLVEEIKKTINRLK